MREEKQETTGGLVSVIIPVYNVKAYLERSVNCVLSQTYPDLDIILVDDGSTDGSGELCDTLASGDERIRAFHRENGGAAASRNAGLDAARGGFIAFVDADDFIRPDMLERMMRVQSETDADIVTAGFERVPEETDAQALIKAEKKPEENYTCIEKKDLMEQLFERDVEIVVLWNKLYRRKVFTNVRFPEGRTFEDFYAAHRLLWNCDRMACMDAVLYFYVERTGSVSRAISRGKITDSVEGHEDRVLFFRERIPEQAALAESAMLKNMKWRFSELAAQGAHDDCLWFSSLCGEVMERLRIAPAEEGIRMLTKAPERYYRRIRMKNSIRRLLQ